MGRHAYQSPDILLKIRKANEKKGGPGGHGEGVPWRHRLNISERREFVMAEIRRPGVGRDRSRSSELDIQRAVMTARSPKDSKFGECLINVNTKQDPVLKSRLGRLTTERRRMEFRMQQLKQHFVKNNPCLNHEPLILVERPASPQARHRAKVIENYGEDPDDLKKPGYMRPLRSRCRTPSTLTTIDAFTLKSRKKRNVWEQVMDEKDAPRFTSTVRPCARLTRHEQYALSIGWDAHKPKMDLVKKGPESPRNTPTPRKDLAKPHDPVFVTELARDADLIKSADGGLLKSLMLDQLLAITPPPSRPSHDQQQQQRQQQQQQQQQRPLSQPVSEKSVKTKEVQKQTTMRRARKVAISETPTFITT